jgi:hypothetical protein
MDMSAPILRGEGSSSPQFGPSGRPSFGLTRDQGKRIEVTFALRNGGTLLVIDEMDEELTAELVQGYRDQLAKDIAAGATRMFTDGWAASGQHAWVLLREVVAFSVRPAK